MFFNKEDSNTRLKQPVYFKLWLFFCSSGSKPSKTLPMFGISGNEIEKHSPCLGYRVMKSQNILHLFKDR